MKRKQRGALIVEFVLLLPIMLLLIFSVIYLGLVFHDYNAINTVSREAARYGVIGNKDTNVRTAAHARCNELLSRLYTVTNNDEDILIVRDKESTLSDEKYLEITITAKKDRTKSMELIDEFIPDTLTGKTRMRVEVDAPAETTTDKDKDKDKDDADAPKTKN